MLNKEKNMTTMISEIYEAFIDAGAGQDKAKAAAEAMSSESLATKDDLKRIEYKLDKELLVIKWMLGLIIVVQVLPLLKQFF
jgi:hypothetical protein